MPQIKRQFKTISRRSDSVGNMLIVDQEPLYKNYKIYISLVSEGGRKRLIGEVDTQNKIMLVKRDKAKHYHRASNSYGFNKVVIEEIGVFRRVLLMEIDGDQTDYYLIPDTVILKEGHKLNFVSQGFELQWFLPMQVILKYKFGGRWQEGKMIEPSNHQKNI